jgi:integrase
MAAILRKCATKRRAEACQLFGPYATAWRETYEKSLKHVSSRNKLKHQIDVHCKALHKMRMDEITTDHIIKLALDPIRHKVETCRDVRQRLDQSARAVEITLLTVARTHEIQNMRWSQLDLDHGEWNITGAGVETAAPGETEGGTGTKN